MFKFGLIISFLLLQIACEANLRVTLVERPLSDSLAAFQINNVEKLFLSPNITMKWTPLSQKLNYRVLVSHHASCEGEPVKTLSTKELSASFEGLANGRYYLCLFADAGGISYPAVNNGYSFVIYEADQDQMNDMSTYDREFSIQCPLDDIAGLDITWSQESGPGLVAFDDIHVLKPMTKADKDGLYVVRGELRDKSGQTAVIRRSFMWDQTPPVFVSAALINAASDGFVNSLERSGSASVVGNLVGDGFVKVGYQVIAFEAPCDGQLSFSELAPAANSPALSQDGHYQICIQLIDETGLSTFGRSNSFRVDTLPASFTSIALNGPALDAALSPAEHSSALDLVGSLVASDAFDIQYALADAASNCSGPLSYAAAIPRSDDARFVLAGSYKVCVRVQDEALNPPAYGSSASIAYTLTVPSFTSLLGANGASDAMINDSEKSSGLAAWTLAATDYATATYSVPLDDTTGTLSCDASKTYSQGSIPLISSLTDSTWVICVKLTDASGAAAYGKSQRITRDTVFPVFTSLAVSGAAADGYINDSEKLLMTALFSLTASGQSTASYTLALDDTGTIVCDATQSYNQSAIATPASLSSDAPYAVCVKLTDAAGNITYGKSGQLIRDIVGPSFSSLNGTNEASDLYIKSGEEASVLPLFTLSASGQTSADFTVGLSDSPSSVSCDSSKTYDQASVPTVNSLSSDGTFAVCVRLRDAAGNTSYDKSQAVVRDIVAPVFTSLNGANEAADGFINDGEKASILAAWALLSSGASTTDYTLPLDDTTPLSCNGTQTYNQSSIPHVDAMNADKPWAICVRIRDAAGNTTYGKSQQIVRDIVAPMFTSLGLSGAGSDGYINDSEKALATALWALTASGQSETAYTLPLSDTSNSLVCNASKTYGQSAIATPAGVGSDGAFAICVQLSDEVGNVVYGKSAQIVRDIVAPTFTSLNGVNEASDGYIKSGEESSAAPLISLISSGSTAIDYTVALDDSTPITCNSGKTYNQSAVPAISALTADGSYAVCVRLTDAAGNIIYGKSQTIVHDIAAPVFTSLAGANGASDGFINNSEKTSTLAAWALVSSGATTSDYTLPLDDSGGALVCNAGKSYSEASVPGVDTMTSDGPWAICVRLRDAAGNAAYGKSQQIIRDTGVPTSSPVGFTLGAIPSGTSESPPASWTASQDQESAVARYEVQVHRADDHGVAEPWRVLASGSALDALELDPYRAYYMKMRAVDLAGNVSEEVVSESWIPSSDGCRGSLLTNTPYAAGSGTQNSPYIICTAAQLSQISQRTSDFSSWFQQAADVELSQQNFTPIGTVANPFRGRYFGQNKTIHNLTVTASSGDYIGLFGVSDKALIDSMNLKDSSITVPNSQYVGSLIGQATNTTITNSDVLNGAVEGLRGVGLYIGGGQSISIFHVVASGQVSLSQDLGGGIVGYCWQECVAYDAELDVNISGRDDLGGIFGGTYASLMQKTTVRGAITGRDYIGGLYGSGCNEPIRRSSFVGSISGGQALGGLLGQSCEGQSIYRSFADVSISGEADLGGLGGSTINGFSVYDSYARGTITGNGAVQERAGGIAGSLDSSSLNVNRSYAAVNISGQFSQAGGLIGVFYSFSTMSGNNFFTTGNIIGNSAGNDVSIMIGEDTSTNGLAGASYYWSGAECTNDGAGNCGNLIGSSVGTFSDFYDQTKLPLSNFNFTDVWRENANAFPTLRSDLIHAPVVTSSCAATATTNINYLCTISATDNDADDKFSIKILKDHSCLWVSAQNSRMNMRLRGTPQAGDVGTCTVSFVVTDGVNDSSVQTLTITVSP